jgi:hypothetical protein
MSGVFSTASHAALQYLPSVTVQLHPGCEHFLSFAMFVFSLDSLDDQKLPATSPYERAARLLRSEIAGGSSPNAVASAM